MVVTIAMPKRFKVYVFIVAVLAFFAVILRPVFVHHDLEPIMKRSGQFHALGALAAPMGKRGFESFTEFFSYVRDHHPEIVNQASADSPNPFPGLLAPGLYERLHAWSPTLEAESVPLIWWNGEGPKGRKAVLFLNGHSRLIPRADLDDFIASAGGQLTPIAGKGEPENRE